MMSVVSMPSKMIHCRSQNTYTLERRVLVRLGLLDTVTVGLAALVLLGTRTCAEAERCQNLVFVSWGDCMRVSRLYSDSTDARQSKALLLCLDGTCGPW